MSTTPSDNTNFLKHIEEWRTKLLDLTKRNPLISLKTEGRGSAALIQYPSPDCLWERLFESSETMTFYWKEDLVSNVDDSDEDTIEQAPITLEVAKTYSDKPSDSGIKSPNSGRAEKKWQQIVHAARRHPNALLAKHSDAELKTKLRTLTRRAKESLSEQGIQTLHLAIGTLRWRESPDSDIWLTAPLLLLPVRLEHGSPNSPWSLSLVEDEILPNPSLSELLRQEFGWELPAIPDFENNIDENSGEKKTTAEMWRAWMNSIQTKMQRYIQCIEWTVEEKVILGLFRFQKLPIWNDLGTHRDKIADHPICRALCGDETRLAEISPDISSLENEQTDQTISPEKLYTFLDCDSSQLKAILAVERGASIVLDGPPGTGKSQTIANIIAQLIANGKKVLFVSEKRAALEVVRSRLEKHQLSDFCLNCHQTDGNRQGVYEELQRSLTLPRETWPVADEKMSRLYHWRASLNRYVQILHVPSGKMKKTPWWVHGRISALRRMYPNVSTRFTSPHPTELTYEQFRQRQEIFEQLKQLRSVLEQRETHPWKECVATGENWLTASRDIGNSLERLNRGYQEIAPILAKMTQERLIPDSATRLDCRRICDAILDLRSEPIFPATWFQSNPSEAIQILHEIRNRRVDIQNRKTKLETIFRPGSWNIPELQQELKNLCEIDSLPISDRIRWKDLSTLKQRRKFLELLSSLTQRAMKNVAETAETLRYILQVLQLQESLVSKYSLISVIVQLVEYVTDIPPMPRSWFQTDETKRMELQKTLELIEKLHRKRNAIWESLQWRLNSQAFTNDSRKTIEKVNDFQSFLKRLFSGKWKQFRHDVWKQWYHENMPEPAGNQIFHDLHQLENYHAITEEMNQLWRRITSDENDLKFPENLDQYQLWIKGIAVIPKIAKLFQQIFPSQFGSLLSTEGELDREALCKQGQKLKQLYQDGEECLSELRRGVSFTTENHTEHLTERSLSSIEKTLAELTKNIAEIAITMDQSIRKIRVESDLSVCDYIGVYQQMNFLEMAENECRKKEQLYTERFVHKKPLVQESVFFSTKLCEADETDDHWDKRFMLADRLMELMQKSSFYFRTMDSPFVRYLSQEYYRESMDHQVETLRRYMDNVQSSSQNLAKMEELYVEDWQVVERLFLPEFYENKSLKEISQRITQLISELPQLKEWIDYRELVQRIQMEFPELFVLLQEIFSGTLNVDQAGGAFELSFWQQWLADIYAKSPDLRNFRVEEHEQKIQQFQALDHDIIDHSFQRVRQRLLNTERPSMTSTFVGPHSELGILKRELEKRRRRLSIRQLFKKIPSILLQLKPCLMMSPLAVSTYLDGDQYTFDVVIFDEASQVCPWDAIGAIHRGKQLIVAGDQKQLPPTRYFEKRTDETDTEIDTDEEDTNSIGDFESILDICCPLMNRFRLKWHYRSRREPLIAFSNQNFYNNDMITFPSVYDDSHSEPAVRLHYVPDGVWQQRTNRREAKATAELVREHFEKHPNESLGVVTFGISQQDAVEDAIDEMREEHPELDPFFQDTQDAPFFVKNLETVQGDERDRMILCVGYARDPHGKLAMRFGPLNLEGGGRRLNVAITRAKYGLTMVSSIKYSDLSEVGRGPKLLRAYLEYAEKGPDLLRGNVAFTDQTENEEYESPFEMEVETALIAKGLHVTRQVGCSGYRIDLALSDPKISNRFLLGIECDGATYHSSATARDRDRLRQEVLEGLGWTISRVWSTDWWQNPEKQIQRILEQYQLACAKAQETKGTSPKPVIREFDRMREVTLCEKPKTIRRPCSSVQQYYFNDIADVPEKTIYSQILDIYQINGRMPREELLRQVRESLGFARLGDRIRKRLENVVRDMLQMNLIELDS